MKNLTLDFTDGTTRDMIVEDATANELVAAFNEQRPCHPMVVIDGSTLYVNTRNLCTIEVETLEEPEEEVPEEEDVPEEAAPVEEEGETPEEEVIEDTRTVAELKAALDDAGVDYDSGLRKAELQEIALSSGI